MKLTYSFRRRHSRFVLLALQIFPVGLLLGCSSTSQVSETSPSEGRTVVGSGTENDRAAINSTSQQIMSAESAQSPDAAPAAATPNVSLP